MDADVRVREFQGAVEKEAGDYIGICPAYEPSRRCSDPIRAKFPLETPELFGASGKTLCCEPCQRRRALLTCVEVIQHAGDLSSCGNRQLRCTNPG